MLSSLNTCVTANILLLNEAYAAACPGGLQVYIFKSLEEGVGDLPLPAFHCAAQALPCTASF